MKISVKYKAGKELITQNIFPLYAFLMYETLEGQSAK